MTKMKIITVYELTTTDGYEVYGKGIYYLHEVEADLMGKELYGPNSIRPIKHSAIEVGLNEYLILKSTDTIALTDTDTDALTISAKVRIKAKQQALNKLTLKERELLGLQ